MIGYVYKIIDKLNLNILYIGSTINSLTIRWSKHKYDFKRWMNGSKNHKLSISKYFKQYGIENFELILIKKYQIFDRKHLHIYEQLFISNTKCINKQNPFVIKSLSYKIYQKQRYEYYQKNKTKLIKYYSKKIECNVCKCYISKKNLSRHRRTTKHKLLLTKSNIK
jgi:hypothetical protein